MAETRPRLSCAHRSGLGYVYRPRSLADVRQLLAWIAGRGAPVPHIRRQVAEAIIRYLVEREAEMRDREEGCVALLLDAAQRVGEVRRAAILDEWESAGT